MESSDSSIDAMLKLADSLGELEIIIGEKARPVIHQVRAKLTEGLAARERGDLPAAIDMIRAAMEKLASFGSQLDADEGALMRMIAERFTQALTAGDRGTAKQAVELMRHKAGDPRKDDKPDW